MKKKAVKYLMFFALVFGSYLLNAQGPVFQWAKEITGAYPNWNSMQIDAMGNVYIIGDFSGSVDFDPGPGTFVLNSTGSSDIFISKLDSSGNFIWAKAIGGNLVEVTSIALDNMGNAYTTGYFSGTVDFNPGVGTYNLTGSNDGDTFILKLDSSGNFIWAKQMVSLDTTYFHNRGKAIIVDGQGNIYTTGDFAGVIDFDPGAGVYTLNDYNLSIYVSKLDSAGNFIWAKGMFGSTLGAFYTYASAIALDADDNVFTSGQFEGSMDFDPGAGVFNMTDNGGYGNNYLSKLDSAGNFVWAKQMGVINYYGYIDAIGIKVDGSGNVYTTGEFQDTIDFDPGPGVFNLHTLGGLDIYILKLNNNGNFIWAKQLAGTAAWGNTGASVDVDLVGNVYTTGLFRETVDFDPNAGTYPLTGLGYPYQGGYLSKLDSSGNFVWAKQLGGNNYLEGMAIRVNSLNTIYTMGQFQGTTDFDVGPGTYDLNNGTMYILKMSQCYPPVTSLAISACDHYTLGSQTYTSSGIHTFGYASSGLCDSIVNINIIINPTIVSSTFQTACTSYFWNGQFYTSSGIYTHTFTSVAGCDSIVTLHLTIIPPVTSSTTQAACMSYSLNGLTYTSSGIYTQTLTSVTGCDSLLILHLTINPIVSSNVNQTACTSYFWNGQFYNSSGIYTEPFTSVAGCDSIAILHLTINPVVTSNITQTACTSYLWNGQTYTSNGIYTQTYTNAVGCDSITTLHLTINQNITSNINQTTCTSYLWNGQTYTSSGIYTDTFTSSIGCDSIAILHLIINQIVTSNINQTACTSYLWSGQTYTSSGIYTYTFTSSIGCDSIAILHLIINQIVTSNINQTACTSYFWNGQTYTISGIYTHTFTSFSGCDSIVTLHLIINQIVTSNTNQTACASYLWNGLTYTSSGIYTHTFTSSLGCDSMATLHLVINQIVTSNINQTACTSYFWNGQTYTSSGIYTQTFTTVAGCDSVLTLHLFLNSVNITVAQAAYSIWSNAPAATYQWLHCENNMPIPGATNQGYTTLTGGSYAVIVTVNGCTDTSACYDLYSVGAEDIESDFIQITPNPAHTEISINTGKPLYNAQLTLINLSADIILKRENMKGNHFVFDISGIANGIYFLKIIESKNIHMIKIVKE